MNIKKIFKVEESIEILKTLGLIDNMESIRKYIIIKYKSRIQTKKIDETSTAAVDPRHLKVEVAEYDFPNCSYVINRICQYPMLIM